MKTSIVNSDILAWTDTYDGPKFHTILCDPPYHLKDLNERFSAENAAPAQFGTDGAFQRMSRGFMGQTWDGGDIAYRPDTWVRLARHLHPGGFIIAFGSTRGQHRMAVAMEDAGLIIHPMMAWMFKSGFPKATRPDTQIDKRAGAERKTVGTKKQTGAKFKLTQELIDNGGFNDSNRQSYEITAPSTELAQAFEGHRYGIQALKPAFEPIIIAQKPYGEKRSDKPLDAIIATGAGTFNIDGARVGDKSTIRHNRVANSLFKYNIGGEAIPKNYTAGSKSGNWPSNYIDVGGSTDEMFFCADYVYERLEDPDFEPALYVPKVSAKERNAGLQGSAVSYINDGRKAPSERPYLRNTVARLNPHPTLKPISLIKYLATLFLPPNYYAPNRRIMIPFGGVGSEVIGALLAGWDEVVAIEQSAEYCDVGRRRVAFFERAVKQLGTTDPKTLIAKQKEIDANMSIFDIIEVA